MENLVNLHLTVANILATTQIFEQLHFFLNNY
jgi:hypothetical protein